MGYAPLYATFEKMHEPGIPGCNSQHFCCCQCTDTRRKSTSVGLALPIKSGITYGLITCLLYTLNAMHSTEARKPPGEEVEPDYWRRLAEEDLRRAIERPINSRAARNVVLFIGDGMSLSTVTAARIFKGQLKGANGEEEVLAFENFTNVALTKTYNVDHQVPDSAATATAFLCGVKANYGTIGLNAHVPRGDCARSKGQRLTCIAELAQRAGKATGVVTTGRITHATPAPLYSSSVDRMWEDDSLLPAHARRKGCRDIASQFVDRIGRNLDVVLGGGRKNLTPNTTADPEHSNRYGQRRDGRDIIQEWMKHKLSKTTGTGSASSDSSLAHAQYVWNKEQFDRVDPAKTKTLLGLFEHSHMNFDGDQSQGEPNLSEMVEKAIRILNSNKKGFFLLVEGARIDHGHHENTARRALEETVALEAAVRRALELLGTNDETLIIVTADHSHPLNIGSYAMRGNPILGLTDFSDDIHQNGLSDVDGLPYTTLSYANGPGYSPRINLTGVDTEHRHYRQVTSVPAQIVSHDGTDVPLYATGPMAHLFHSTHEQNYIFHVITYAACLQTGSKHTHAHCAGARKSLYDVTSCSEQVTSGADSGFVDFGFRRLWLLVIGFLIHSKR